MKIKSIYLSFLFLIFGFFSLQSGDCDAFSPHLYLETEIEESIDDSIKLSLEKKLSDSDFEGGDKNDDIISSQDNSLATNFFAIKFNLASTESKNLPEKSNLFILYCCLKLDC